MCFAVLKGFVRVILHSLVSVCLLFSQTYLTCQKPRLVPLNEAKEVAEKMAELINAGVEE